jgi:hypothetical protein
MSAETVQTGLASGRQSAPCAYADGGKFELKAIPEGTGGLAFIPSDWFLERETGIEPATFSLGS